MTTALLAPGRWLWRQTAGSWLVMSLALVVSTVWLAPQPATWRRPVSDEFWRFVWIGGPLSLWPMAVAATLVGLGLLGQGLYWLEITGQRDVVLDVLVTLLIREVTPVVVGIVMLGCVGLVNLSELGEMRADGTVRALQAQGVDPVVFFAVPRALALASCTFVHAVGFVALSVTIGHFGASFLGVTFDSYFATFRFTFRVIGEIGVFVLPLKSLIIGTMIATVTTVTALADDRQATATALLPRGFFRAFILVFVVSVLGSLVS